MMHSSSGSTAGGSAPHIMEQTLGPSAPPMHRATTIKCLMNAENNGLQQQQHQNRFDFKQLIIIIIQFRV
jgi:hypothetical protein